jgi:hypothetical protein
MKFYIGIFVLIASSFFGNDIDVRLLKDDFFTMSNIPSNTNFRFSAAFNLSISFGFQDRYGRDIFGDNLLLVNKTDVISLASIPQSSHALPAENPSKFSYGFGAVLMHLGFTALVIGGLIAIVGLADENGSKKELGNILIVFAASGTGLLFLGYLFSTLERSSQEKKQARQRIADMMREDVAGIASGCRMRSHARDIVFKMSFASIKF